MDLGVVLLIALFGLLTIITLRMMWTMWESDRTSMSSMLADKSRRKPFWEDMREQFDCREHFREAISLPDWLDRWMKRIFLCALKLLGYNATKKNITDEDAKWLRNLNIIPPNEEQNMSRFLRKVLNIRVTPTGTLLTLLFMILGLIVLGLIRGWI